MSKQFSIGADWDGTMANNGEEHIEPSLVEVLTQKSGVDLLLTVVTGRFPLQIEILGGKDWKDIQKANSNLNINNVHIYAGGDVVSDNEDNIYNHQNNVIEDDQIERISELVLEMQREGLEPFIVFQSARNSSTFKKTGWRHGVTNMLYTNPNDITEIRDKMYLEKNQLPQETGALAKFISMRNPAKLIIVSSKFEGDPQMVSSIKNNISEFGLTLTGNHKSGLDICRAEVNKVSGIQTALEILELPYLDFYAGDSIGEHGNDLPVFMNNSVAKRGIIVSNGKDLPNTKEFKLPYDIVNNAQELGNYLKQLTEEA
jgi:hydroxymethylpyrimidine pyrophosphatase-like HAD family hydrolase